MALSSFNLNVPGVVGELNKLDKYIEDLVNLYTKLEEINLQAGWDSTVVRVDFNQKFKTIRDNITEIKGCLLRVRENVEKHKSLVQRADEAGSKAASATTNN